MAGPKNGSLVKKRRLGLKHKLALFFCLTTLIIVLTGIGTGYLLDAKLLHDAIGESYVKMADNLGISVSGLLEMIIEHVKVYLTNVIHIDAIAQANKKYEGKNQGQIEKSLLEIDKDWAKASPDSALVSQYTHTPSADRLHTIAKSNKYIPELFTTDKFGAVVAASGKTTDFYQADEEWWQKAYNNGKGAFYISDVEFDASSKTISLTIAIPVKDLNGQVIGVSKAVVAIKNLFETIGNFKIGKTGHAILVDNNGKLIFHKGEFLLTEDFCGGMEFANIIHDHDKHPDIYTSYRHKEKLFSAFSVINNPHLLECGIIWRIFIIQSPQEVFSPLYKLFVPITVVAIIMIILLIPAVFIFANLFINPLIKLHQAVKHIQEGNFNYSIDIKTGDEIESLGDSFKIMSKRLSDMLDNLITKNLKLEEANQKNLNLNKILEQEIDIRKKVEETYNIIFESANDGILIGDINTYKVVDANNRVCEMFGYPKNEFVGFEPSDVNTDNSQYPVEKFKLAIDSAIKGTQKIFEWPVKDKIGRQFWIEANLRPMVVRGRSLFLAIIRDITERKQLIEQRENLMDIVAHELRTPLGAIKEGINLVLEECVGKIAAKQKELLSIAKTNVDRLAKLVGQALDIQKLSAGRVEFDMKENDINEVIREVHRTMLSLVSKKKISFKLELADMLPQAEFDREKIIEVLINLINNAFKFTEEGQITITSGLENNFIRVSIKDTGIGIKAADLPKLFQRFTQLKRTPGSSGLGLYICKEIIEVHKGKIWVESEENKGTSFYFTLPVKKDKT